MSRRSDRIFERHFTDRQVVFSLVGNEGAATFSLQRMPNDLLRAVDWEEMVALDGAIYLGIDLGVHYRTFHEGFSYMSNCVAFGNAECWYDGSSLAGMELTRHWKESGMDEGVIRHTLEIVYEREFGDE